MLRERRKCSWEAIAGIQENRDGDLKLSMSRQMGQKLNSKTHPSAFSVDVYVPDNGPTAQTGDWLKAYCPLCPPQTPRQHLLEEYEVSGLLKWSCWGEEP